MRRFAIITLAALALAACSEVPVGHKGVEVSQGTLAGVSDSGLVWHGPLTDVYLIDVRQQKDEATTAAYTKDVQQADIAYAVTYRLDEKAVKKTYQTVGEDWKTKLVPQVVENTIKDVFGKAEAVKDAINNRGVLQQNILRELRTNLKVKNVIVEGFEIKDIGFSDAFEAAVEQKQIAVETANAERNKTAAVRERAEQTIITAKAAAEAMKIKSEALSGNPGLTAYEYATRWDGKMPQIVTSSNAPMLMQVK